MSITIAAANALHYAPEIKELFLAHERPEFPDYFDRAYPRAFANGATSWLGRDPHGRLVMHAACLARHFRFGSRDVVGGLLANVMVAKLYRTFFPARALLDRLVQDAKAGGVLDFLYADPNVESRSLLYGTRFVRVGTLQRYVLPVGDRRRYRDLGIRLFHAMLRARPGGGSARRRARVIPHAAGRFQADDFRVPPEQSPRLAAHHDQALYESRLQGYPGDHDWWLTCHGDASPNRAEVALLVRGPDASGLATLHALRWAVAPGLPPAAFVPSLIAELRRRRCERLQVTTVAESALGRALRRCGFIPRPETVPLVALPLTPLGEECTRSVRDWEITDVDCDR